MVQSSDTRDRKSLLAKQPLVPYADDGPAAKDALAVIHNEMKSYGESPKGLDAMDKERPRWTRILREARMADHRSRHAGARE